MITGDGSTRLTSEGVSNHVTILQVSGRRVLNEQRNSFTGLIRPYQGNLAIRFRGVRHLKELLYRYKGTGRRCHRWRGYFSRELGNVALVDS